MIDKSLDTLKAAIRKRRSVRTYQKVKLKPEDKQFIESILSEAQTIKGPFNHTIEVLDLIEQPSSSKEKIGTYGFIKNAPAFIVGATKNNIEHLIDFGYVFEWIILNLTDHNLGSVWLGGTFRRIQFEKFLDSKDAFIPAITPVGYPKEKMSFREQALRGVVQAKSRKPLNEIVFEVPSMQGFKRTKDPKLAKIFDMVRFGPSASNNQPWRFYIDKNIVHVYLAYDESYNNKLHYDIQYLDIGASLCHLEIGLKTHDFTFKTVHSPFKNAQQNEYYIISYKIKAH